jgi:predicted GNAT family acetyltransferase
VAATVTRDPAAFRARVHGWLAERPMEHNVPVTVAEQATAGVFAWVADGDAIIGAALRTPPHPLLTSVLDAATAGLLIAAVLEADPVLPGVTGPEPAARLMAEAWAAQTGGSFSPRLGMTLYGLDDVVEPTAPPPGRPRLAAGRERARLVAWAGAFTREAGAAGVPPELAVDRRMQEDRLFVWDDERAVSMVGTSPPVAGVTRVSMVYTPPEARGRGYASALVADVCRRALGSGCGHCILYADRANPTANRIYQAIGFRPIAEAQEYSFVTRPAGAARARA